MSHVEGFPFFEFQVDKNGRPVDPGARAAAVEFFGSGGVSDMLVVSHGWNNDMAEARELYVRLLRAARALVDAGKSPLKPPRALGVLGVLWPSKKFADKDLIPGQAASTDDVAMFAAIAEHIDSLKGGFDAPDADARLDQAKALLPRLAESPRAQRDLVALVRGLLGEPPKSEPDEGPADAFSQVDGADMLVALQGPVFAPVRSAGDGGGALVTGDAAGGAAGIGTFFSGIASGSAIC